MKKRIFLFSLIFSLYITAPLSKLYAQRPQSNTFNCAWNGSIGRCRIHVADCDRAGGQNPDPNFCAQFKSTGECKGKTSSCKNEPLPTLNTQLDSQPGGGADIFCEGNSGVKTALGCISTDPALFIEKFLKFGVGIAGGIAFLLILFGGFQIITSAGNPEQMNAGKELISSAIAGLLLIIFSILLLKIIGFNILGIPDFS